MTAKRYKNEDYSFVCGYIASRDKYLLTQERIDRMLESKTADDALRILLEMNYGEEIESISPIEFEAILSGELEKAYSFVLPFVPDRSYFEMFLYPGDYHNIKTLLKAESLGIEADELLMETGTIPAADLKDLVRERNYDDMRDIMADGMKDALEEYSLSHDPQCIDLILDKACYKDMSLLVSGLNSDFIKEYMALRIDLINLTTFIRIREMGKPPGFYSKGFVEGGNIPEQVFEDGFEEHVEQFAERLDNYGLHDVLIKSAKMIRETGRITVLEKLCDNYLMEYLKQAKYITYGIEPLIAYIAARENEIKTVRIIMAGKLAGISPDLLRERVREPYA